MFVLLRLVAALLMLGARRLPRPASPVVRLALANIHRPGAVTPSVVMSLGLGVAVLPNARSGAIPSGNAAPEAETGLSDLPEPGSYVLFVSTLEARKNHALLFRVWRRLLSEMPREQVPTLVFAGRVGWLVADLMQQLENAEWLGGKIRLVRDPSDEELLALYRGCRFTLYPSLYEGWGLPVSESLALGRPCIASNRTSLPEAGGALARYFDPDDLDDACATIRAVIEDPEGLEAWRERVAREFRAAKLQPLRHGRRGFVAERHDALLVALAGDVGQTAGQVHVAEV